jgi:hypothetical protein
MMNPEALEKGGVGALELVAMDMKARLSYFYKHAHSQPYVLILYMYLKYILFFFIFLISGACIYVARLATRVLNLKLLKQH